MKTTKDFIIEDGVLIKYKGKEREVSIPEGVVCIGSNAFAGCNKTIKVIIPNSVTKIKDKAFFAFNSVKHIVIPNTVTYIGNGAFSFCNSLESIEIPSSVTRYLGLGLFNSSISLAKVKILSEVELDNMWTFQYCHSLKEIYALGELGINTLMFISKKARIHILTAPATPWSRIKATKLTRAAARGYLYHPDVYKNVDFELIRYISLQKKELLQEVFAKDMEHVLDVYVKHGHITEKNFDKDFFKPAQEANAVKCIAFLMDWKNKNILEKNKKKHIEKEFTI